MSDIRTPPSLKWLLDRRARLLGEIQRNKKVILALRARADDEISQLERRLAQLKAQKERQLLEEYHLKLAEQDLKAIDGALRQHDVKVDLELVRPIRPQTAGRHLGYGKMTKYIFEFLKSIRPNSASANEVALFISTKEHLSFDEIYLQELRECVRKRMKTLASSGKIVPLHNRKTGLEGRWRLPASPDAGPTESQTGDVSLASIHATIWIEGCGKPLGLVS